MRFFSYIQKHPARFFWISVLYMAVLSPVCEIFLESNWLHTLVIAPINLVTWPVAYAFLSNGNWKKLKFCPMRLLFSLPIVSTLLTVAPLL